MTTKARQAEADRVELVYYWAVNQLGNAAAIDALRLYDREQALPPNPSSTGWLTQVVQMLFGFRSPAAELAIAYYRLVRALRIGTTVAHGESAGDVVSLEQLRKDFEEIVDFIDVETGEGDGEPIPSNVHLVEDDDDITVEDIGDIDQIVAEMDEAAQAEAIDQLDNLGNENLIKAIDRGDDETEAYRTARARQAAAAMRISMNAARGLVYNLADTDLKIIGWVRYSQTGDPCGWCAMLISRGLVYKTRASASGDVGDVDKYHENCHCVAVPVFSAEQYNAPLFDQNREYDALWKSLKKLTAKQRIEQYGTADLLAIFRKLFRAGPATTAQEAA